MQDTFLASPGGSARVLRSPAAALGLAGREMLKRVPSGGGSPLLSPVPHRSHLSASVPAFELSQALLSPTSNEDFESPHFDVPLSRQTSMFSDTGLRDDVVEQPRSQKAILVHGIILGLVNYIVCVPTLISYAAIVFRLPVFKDDMPKLVKLFFLSSAVHQAVYSVLSSMAFSIGQVQDVGLIFLAQIATTVYNQAISTPGVSYRAAAATVLVACAIGTTFTGAVVWLVGKLRYTRFVQLLPMPVVGGYLGYIGYFCLAAGATLGTGLDIEGPSTWGQVLRWDPVLWAKLALILGFGAFLYVIATPDVYRDRFPKLAYKLDNIATLPVVLCVVPVLFFVVIACLGVSVEEAREQGWVPFPDAHPEEGWQCIKLYNDFGIVWEALLTAIPHMLGLATVVTFGSVLDIAAIQAGQPNRLDFDGELRMIGVGNFLSGITCGFTGSYIFSQTIFSQRQRVASRVNGWIIAIGEFILFLLPIDVLQFFPGFYIGGILAFFGFDIMMDWLARSRDSVGTVEYILLWMTFCFVMFVGVIEGCVLGILSCACFFIVAYAMLPPVTIRTGVTSTAARSLKASQDLKRLNNIALVEFRGYLFFGAALHISDNLFNKIRALQVTHVVLDFSAVESIDSTSARALSKLRQLLLAHGMGKIAFSVPPKAKYLRLLAHHEVLPEQANGKVNSHNSIRDQIITEGNIDEALAWCERSVLGSLSKPISPAVSGKETSQITKIVAFIQECCPNDEPKDCEDLARVFDLRSYTPGETIFSGGSQLDAFFLLFAGEAVGEQANHALQQDTFLPSGGKTTFEPGAFMGETDFYLKRRVSYTARATGKQGCMCAVLTRSVAEALERDSARLALLAHRLVLTSVCNLVATSTKLHMRS